MILGLDLSTSMSGWCLIDDSGSLVEFGYVKTNSKKLEDLFDKFKAFKKEMFLILKQYRQEIKTVAVEQALSKFSRGQSTALTINKLVAFNFCVSNWIYEELGIKPTPVSVISARSKFGCSVPRGTKDKEKKEFVRKKVAKKFPKIQWELTRNNTQKPYNYDIADSIVIGYSVYLNEQDRNKI